MTSKAARLGAGSSFAQTQTVSARRQAINSATKAPTEGAPPPVKLPVGLISLNPSNPRSDLGDLYELGASLRDHGQKQAITIMSRFAYLEAHPDHAENVEEGTKYVAIDGNSRLAAAREAGLAEIKVTVDEDLGANADEVLESALVANIHRKDLDPLDEARALRQLLQVVGTQQALAARLHRSQGWVSQRLALLGLTPELQEKLTAGEEPAELLRQVGNKKPEEQAAHLTRLKEKKAGKKRTAVSDSVPAPAPTAASSVGGQSAGKPSVERQSAGGPPAPRTPADYYGVIESASAEPTGASESEGSGEAAAALPSAVEAPSAVSQASSSASGSTGPESLATQIVQLGGAGLMDAVREHLNDEERSMMLHRYFMVSSGVEQVAADLGRGLPPSHRADLGGILRQVAEILSKE
ncbi:chromosome partitioning protein ParB [Streptomyces sp. CS227]|uniref:ParB/RepB/Spo0J family partition protein n=1 Tax=Streptomyces sp. CS227 TaxID=1982763 RepID=UPI000B40BD90|nr:ParB/RepB/Spo0J family partition protein [Streptomyces sp. CS227]OWA01057.1 chromosome partitioning protein ParB [Streptomyces sp. CS227]